MNASDFADWIEAHIEVLTAEWVDSVRQDSRIHSDDDLLPPVCATHPGGPG